MSPKRIQLRRTKGWRKPEGAVVVSRPSRWGNPWTAAECRGSRDLAAAFFDSAMGERLWHEANGSDSHEVPNFYPPLDAIRAELRGRDLACWCPLDESCHADVLLEIANGRQYSDPADYGPATDTGGDPSDTTCRVCGHLAIEHTRGRYSIHGVCPVPLGNPRSQP